MKPTDIARMLERMKLLTIIAALVAAFVFVIKVVFLGIDEYDSFILLIIEVTIIDLHFFFGFYETRRFRRMSG